MESEDREGREGRGRTKGFGTRAGRRATRRAGRRGSRRGRLNLTFKKKEKRREKRPTCRFSLVIIMDTSQ